MAISEDNTRVQVTMSKELRSELEKEAEATKRSLSNHIVFLLEKRNAKRHCGLRLHTTEVVRFLGS
jgi:hypothetical protein